MQYLVVLLVMSLCYSGVASIDQVGRKRYCNSVSRHTMSGTDLRLGFEVLVKFRIIGLFQVSALGPVFRCSRPSLATGGHPLHQHFSGDILM